MVPGIVCLKNEVLWCYGFMVVGVEVGFGIQMGLSVTHIWGEKMRGTSGRIGRTRKQTVKGKNG